MTYLRLLLAAVGLLSALTGWWLVSAACIGLLAVRFASWEAIGIGVLMDYLWLPAEPSLYAWPLFTIGSLVAVWIFAPLRAEFLT